MLVEPWVLVEVIRVSPAIVENCLFQRRRHRRGHGFRAGAGEAAHHQDGRKIDIGQITDRQQAIGKQAENDDRNRDQRRHDRPADEGFG